MSYCFVFMKKFIAILIVMCFVVAGLVMGSTVLKPAVTDQPQQQTANEQGAVQSAQASDPTTPITFSIPKLGVIAAVESVGMDAKGNMDVPKNDNNVAWYNLGYKPGDQGSAVIAGHYDTRSGSPAVFYNLTKLQSGDLVKVTDTSDTTYTYKVTEITTYDFDKVPMQQVFASTDKARLNLITCEGTFDRASRNYSKRTVVYTELVH